MSRGRESRNESAGAVIGKRLNRLIAIRFKKNQQYNNLTI